MIIARAIKRALGASDSEQYEEIMYEGYGAGGVAILVEVLTDNRTELARECGISFPVTMVTWGKAVLRGLAV